MPLLPQPPLGSKEVARNGSSLGALLLALGNAPVSGEHQVNFKSRTDRGHGAAPSHTSVYHPAPQLVCPPPFDFVVFLFVSPTLLCQTERGAEPQGKRDTSIDSNW